MRMHLSICIATRNRLPYLIETIDSVVPQLVDGVEIVIVDGASNDGTFEYFSKGVSHPSIRYIRLEKNGGLDHDYDLTVRNAVGEYCWLFSDDDVILPRSIGRVLAALVEQPSLVIVNSSVYDATLAKVLHEHEVDPNASVRFGPEETDSLFRQFGHPLTFIGRIVIRRSLWLSRNRVEYFGSYFVHVAVIFQSPLPDVTVFIPTPCLGKRTGNESWSSRSFEIWNILWPKLVWSFPAISDGTKAGVISKQPWNSILQLLKFRILGAYTLEEFRKHIKNSSLSGLRKLFLGAVSIIPGRPLNAVAYLIARAVIPDKPTVIQEIANSRFSIVHIFRLKRLR